MSSTDKIHDIELQLTEGFTGLKEQHKGLSDDIRDIKKDQQRIVHTIYGNGKEGVLEKLAKINQKQTVIWTLMVGLATILLSGLDITSFF